MLKTIYNSLLNTRKDFVYEFLPYFGFSSNELSTIYFF